MKKEFVEKNKFTLDWFAKEIKVNQKIEDVRIGKRSIKDIIEILELIEIENMNIVLKVGTPFIPTTVFLVTLLSTLIPVIYEKTDNRNGNLNYKVEPNFNKFELSGEIKSTFKITILRVMWIINYLKKSNNKQIRRRRKYEQSSYRGVDEYSYE